MSADRKYCYVNYCTSARREGPAVGAIIGAYVGTGFANLTLFVNHYDTGIKDPSSGFMMPDIVKYLRDIAQTCARLARACPDRATSHGLEEVAVDLMAKAKEIEQLHC